MKNFLIPAPLATSTAVRLSRGTLVLQCLVFLFGCMLVARARAGDEAYRINVRSFVEHPHSMWGKKPAIVHGKLYAIAGIKYSNELWEDTSNPISVPVDEDQVLARLRGVLAAHSFQEAKLGQFPDIVLTVFYGRGHMKNPYMDKTMAIAGGDGKVVTASSEQMLRERSEPGYAEKMARAGNEKLFIAINAWEYPGLNSAAKHKLLWRTTVSVDEADRDLNAIAPKMLAAAGPYFDREITEEEVTVMSDLPEGKTSIGPIIDLGPIKPAK